MVCVQMGLDLGGNGAKTTLGTINNAVLGPMLENGVKLLHC